MNEKNLRGNARASRNTTTGVKTGNFLSESASFSWKKTLLLNLTLFLLVIGVLALTSQGVAQEVDASGAVEMLAEGEAAGEEAAAEAEEAVAYASYDEFMATPEGLKFTIDNLWILIAAVLVAMMHLGFATLESGLCQAKNTTNILFKNTFIVSMGIITYYLIGFNTMYPGDDGWIINNILALNGPLSTPGEDKIVGTMTVAYGLDMTMWSDFIFQAMFAATAATIVSGAVAERIKLPGFMVFVTLLVAIAYPIAGSWKWGEGFLDDMGFQDFAGSSIVHAFGGFSALACVIILGPRKGKYLKGRVNAIPPHSMPLATIGVFLLFLGWFGFNGGSVLAADPQGVSYVFVTTALAAAAGCLGSIACAWTIFKTPDLSMALNGVLAGLVGITAGADVIPVPFAILVGFAAGIIVVFSISFLDKAGIDDPVGAISVHGVCGIFGTLAVALGGANIVTQLIGTLSYCAFAFVFSFVVFTIVKLTLGVRVSEEEEYDGLDIGEHKQEAYIVENRFNSASSVPKF